MGVPPVVGVSPLTLPLPQEVGEEPAGTLQKTPIILAKPPAERVSLGGVARTSGGVPPPKMGVSHPPLSWPRPMTSFSIFGQQQPPPAVPKAGPAQAPAPPAPAPPIVLMKAREEGRGGGGASVATGEGPVQAPPLEREGPRPTQPVYQLHSRGLAPPAALDREWAGLKWVWLCGRGLNGWD